MSWLEGVPKSKRSDSLAPFDGEQALRLQMGAASPLWLMFLGAASAGLAFWSFSRWMKLVTPDALAPAGARLRLVRAEPATEPEAEALEAKTPEAKAEPPPVAPTPKAEAALKAQSLEIKAPEIDTPQAQAQPKRVAPLATNAKPMVKRDAPAGEKAVAAQPRPQPQPQAIAKSKTTKATKAKTADAPAAQVKAKPKTRKVGAKRTSAKA